MNFTVLRRPRFEGTPGIMLVEDDFFCFTLEDKVRQDGLKIPGDTAILADRYPYYLEYSEKFKRVMPTIGHVNGFEGIRTHGGESVDNTEGCILTCFKWFNKDKLLLDKNTSATNKICELLGGSETHWIEIVNLWPHWGVTV